MTHKHKEPTEKWARRIIAHQLLVPTVGLSADEQWQRIVDKLINVIDDYEFVRATLAWYEEN